MLCVFYYKYYELVGKWFREVYAFRMKREPGKNPGQYPLL